MGPADEADFAAILRLMGGQDIVVEHQREVRQQERGCEQRDKARAQKMPPDTHRSIYRVKEECQRNPTCDEHELGE